MNVTVLRNQLPREKWAKLIIGAWQKQVKDIFELGVLLESAKAELDHGEWIPLIKNELPFDRSTVSMFIKIATCDHLRNDECIHHLPGSWGTLYDLTKLTPEQFAHGIATGVINPKMQRKDVKALRGDFEKTIVKKNKSKVSSDEPLDLVEVCARFSVQITAVSDELPKEQRAEFFASLRAAIEALEKEQSNG